VKTETMNLSWEKGRLDPARTQPPAGTTVGLQRLSLAPQYLALQWRGDPFVVDGVHHYLPDCAADGSFEIPALPGLETVTVLADLGRVIPGTFEIEAAVPSGVELTFEFGEALAPLRAYRADGAPDGGRRVFCPAIVQGGWTGLRFVWIQFRNVRQPFRIFGLRGLAQLMDAPYLAEFECSDSRLDRIWELCAYSAHTVMGQPVGNDPPPQPVLQTFCLDRCDRVPWAGDSRFIQATVGYVFGQYPLLKSAIERLLPTGTRPIPDLNDIPPYTLDWALGLLDYYRLSGDATYLRQRWADLLAIAAKFDGPVPKAEKGYGLFFDWDERVITRKGAQPGQRPELEAAFTGKHVQFLRELAQAAAWIGEAACASRFAREAGTRAAAWRTGNRDWAQRLGVHAVTNLMVGGVLGSADYEAAFAAVYAARRRWTNSPFFTAQIPFALATMGRHETALELLRDYYGGLLDAGATTVWEEWDPDWHLPVNAQPPQFGPPATWAGLSLDHPVGSTPARWLLEEILGVKPAAPGWSQVGLLPHAAGLDWARGAVATPHGKLTVQWRRQGERLQLDHDLPPGVELRSSSGNVKRRDASSLAQPDGGRG
jgi:hypothetical protein